MPMLVGIVVGIGLTILLQLSLRCLSEAHTLQLPSSCLYGIIRHVVGCPCAFF